MLRDFFSYFFSSIISAKLVVDPSTKNSKGYGFVKFSNQFEYDRALNEMNGKIFLGKPMKIK